MCDNSKEPCLPLSESLSNFNKKSSQTKGNLFSGHQSAFTKINRSCTISNVKGNLRILNLKNIKRFNLESLKIDHKKDKLLVDKLFDCLVHNGKIRKNSLIL